ncbi:MAG: hypothetical protein ACPLZH_01725 [Minisyncoccales bacterium]
MEEEKKEKKRDILKGFLIGLLFFLVLIFIFKIGVFIGMTKTRFFCQWVENYHKNFAGPLFGFKDQLRPPFGSLIENHGFFGEIIKISDKEFVMIGKDKLEKVVVVNEKSIIQEGRREINFSDLKVGDFVVVVGLARDDGKVEARLIRLFSKEDKKETDRFRPFNFFKNFKK